jgi:thymidylate synthase
MKEFLITGKTLPEAYHGALVALHDQGEVTPCADYNTTQKEVSMTYSVEEPLAEPLISRLFIGGFRELEQYRQEMLDGILDFEIDRGNWEYTYHSRMAEQLPFIIRELKRNPSSRRAVIDIRDWRHDSREGNDSPACLQHIQYFIRDGKLFCKVLFRSNDACKATFMNAFALIMLQKRIADELGVGMGTYTHRANSFHCYERDFAMLEGYVNRIKSAEDLDDITYEYEDNWDALMESARPDIAKMVEELKSH